MPLPLAPFRQDFKILVTPLVGDVLFYELRDCGRTEFPEYGTPHPNTKKWPDHKLVYIEEGETDREGVFRFYYAADRQTQDLYNFEFSQADIGGTKFDAISRSYVVPRSEFSEDTVEMASTMPDSPTGKFPADEYILVERQQQRIGQKELDALYVAETRVYIKRVTLTQTEYNAQFAEPLVTTTTLWYKDEVVYGKNTATPLTAAEVFADQSSVFWDYQTTNGYIRSGEQLSANWYAVTERMLNPPALKDGKILQKSFPTPLIGDIIFFELHDCNGVEFPVYGTAHPDTAKWPYHKLVLIEQDDSNRENLFRFYYAADRESQDLYNFEFSQADIGGTNYDAVARTYVVPRADFDIGDVTMASVMPDIPSGKFPANEYILAQREQKRIGQKELDSIYVAETRVYIKRVTLTQIDYDEQFGDPLTTTQKLWYKDEIVDGEGTPSPRTAAQLFASSSDSFWGLQSTGLMREGKQLTANWYAITERQIIPPTLIIGRTYYTTVDARWPAVLKAIEVDTWERKDGGFEQYVRPVLEREAYNGPCKATIVERFYLNPPTTLSLKTLSPLPISISNPLFSVSIDPTLHAGFNLTVSTGTEHPVYEYTAGTYPVTGTGDTTWPNTLVTKDEVSPFRGGWVRQTITINKPY